MVIEIRTRQADVSMVIEIRTRQADVAKLADALDLGSSGAIHVGSTPIIRTSKVDKLMSWY